MSKILRCLFSVPHLHYLLPFYMRATCFVFLLLDLFRFIAFEWFHIFGIFGHFLTLMEMTSLMTGFILNGLSESLLSSRLFRIKAWVLQVPFLSMIFLYFSDYSNLYHSKVFYLFLYLLKICMTLWHIRISWFNFLNNKINKKHSKICVFQIIVVPLRKISLRLFSQCVRSSGLTS